LKISEGDKKIPYQVLAECKGADLVGIKYEQLMPLVFRIKMLKMLLE
jgi:hypothetical protein